MSFGRLLDGGAIRFSRPKRRRLECRYPDHPVLLDVLAVLSGQKPVCYVNVQEADRRSLEFHRDIARFFELQFAYVPRKTFEEVGQIYFAKTKAAIEEASRVKAFDDQSPRMFELLGYPSCCSAFFGRFLHPRPGDELIAMIRANTARAGAHHFVVNNLFNTANRSGGPDCPTRRIPKMHLLAWHPCRFDCEASLDSGRVLWQFVDALAPDLALMLKTALSNVIVYFDRGECAVFDGRVAGAGRCEYSSLRLWTAPGDGGFLSSLGEGNEILLEEGRMTVLKDGRALASRACLDPLLLDFTAP